MNNTIHLNGSTGGPVPFPAFNAPFVEYALYYASLGIPVFPLAVKSKYPRKGSAAYKDATTDPDQIRAWWKTNPGYNIAGNPCGFILCDLDNKHKDKKGNPILGSETFKDLTTETYRSTVTVVQRTPTGGFHVFMKAPPGVTLISDSGRLRGIDCKTNTGYFVLAPSYIDEDGVQGRYEWVDGKEWRDQELPDCPDWFISAYTGERNGSAQARTDLLSIWEGDLDDGEKHTQLRNAIYKMRKQGFPVEVTTEIIIGCIEKIPAERFGKSKDSVIKDQLKDIRHCYQKFSPNEEEQSPQAEPASPEFRSTDLGYSERFEHVYSDDLKYIPERDHWLEAEHDIWQPQAGGDAPAIRKASELARAMANEFTAQALSIEQQIETSDQADPKLAKMWEALHKKAVNMEKTATIRNMVTLAKPMRGFSVPKSALDADPMLLGTNSGVVDLRTLEVLTSGKDRMVTRAIPHEWTPDVYSEQFDDFVCTIMRYEPSMIHLLKCWLGYCLTGDNPHQAFMILYGERGRNGKSVLLKVLSHVLGPYCGVLDKRLIVETRNPATFSLANIEGCRVAIASEARPNSRIDTEFIKAFAGGDEMFAERKGVQGYGFRPQAKLMFSVNTMPWAQIDNSLKDRMVPVPFNQSFYHKSEDMWREGDIPPDPHLDKKLIEDTPGVIGYLAGCVRYYLEHGLIKPPQVKELLATFEADNDIIGQWIVEQCDIQGHLESKTSELFQSYRTWCTHMGIFVPQRVNEFSRRLEREPGLQKKTPKNVSWFIGIKVRPYDHENSY